MSGDVQSITARPVLWRALLFPPLFVLLGVLLATFGFLVFIGTWPLNVRWVLAGIATGVIVGLMLNWRSQPLGLDSESLRGPSRWARVTSIPLDQIDWRIEPSPSLVAWFFQQRVGTRATARAR